MVLFLILRPQKRRVTTPWGGRTPRSSPPAFAAVLPTPAEAHLEPPPLRSLVCLLWATWTSCCWSCCPSPQLPQYQQRSTPSPPPSPHPAQHLRRRRLRCVWMCWLPQLTALIGVWALRVLKVKLGRNAVRVVLFRGREEGFGFISCCCDEASRRTGNGRRVHFSKRWKALCSLPEGPADKYCSARSCFISFSVVWATRSSCRISTSISGGDVTVSEHLCATVIRSTRQHTKATKGACRSTGSRKQKDRRPPAPRVERVLSCSYHHRKSAPALNNGQLSSQYVLT